MRELSLIFLLNMVLFLLPGCKKDNTEPSSYDKEILEIINVHRTGIGLEPLESNEFLWTLAHGHSASMADGSVPFGHDGVSERSVLIRTELGNGLIAENIAWGKGTAQEIVDTWLTSTGHKENIEGNFVLTGLSAVRSKDGNWYYTQIFYKSTN